jgi:hypothetical protein
MKINIVFLFLSFFLSIIIGYAAYTFSSNDFKLFYVISGTSALSIYFFSATALRHADTRKTINLRAVSSIFILIQMLIMFFYSSAGHMIQGFIIWTSLIIIAFFFIAYTILGKNN